jgi:drug/metabolite transporter (DMT)-like permease
MFLTQVLPMVLGSLLVASVGQLVLKLGMGQVTKALPPHSGAFALLLKAATTPLVVLGLAGYVLGAAIWLVVLARAPLSLVYPFAGLTIVLVTLESALLLKEHVLPWQWVGMLLVVIGVTVVAYKPTV